MKFECSPIYIKSSLKDAYTCLWHFKWNHLFISYLAFLPFTFAGILGFLDAFFLPRLSTELVPEGYNVSFILFVVTTYLWAIPCFVLWNRLYLLGPGHFFKRRVWPILTRSIVLIFKVLMMIGIFVILAVIFIIIFTVLIDFLNLDNSISDFLDLSNNEYLGFATLISLTFFFAYLIFLRFSLAISARMIGKRIGLVTSWKLTKKNTLRMFYCYILILLPAIILSVSIVLGYQAILNLDLFYSGEILTRSDYIHIFLLAPAICLPIAASCSQCSSFYRHCGGVECKQD